MPSIGCTELHSHTMYVYRTKADRLKAFLQICQLSDERVHYLFLLDSKALSLAEFIAKQLNIPQIETATSFIPAEQFYSPKVKLSESILHLFEETYQNALQRGFTALHIMVDMGFFLSFMEHDEILDIEKRIDAFFTSHRAKGICIFFYETIPTDLIEPLKAVHNEVHLSESLLYSHLQPLRSETQPLAEELDDCLADLFLINQESWSHILNGNRSAERLSFPPFLSLIEQIIWVADRNLIIKYVSPAVEECLGYSPSSFIRRSMREFMSPEAYEKLDVTAQRSADEALREGSSENRVFRRFHSTIEDSSGKAVEMEHILYPLVTNGRLIGFAGTSRRGSVLENLLTLSSTTLQEKWRDLWNKLPVGIVLSDEEENIHFINDFFSSLTGIREDSVLPPFFELQCWPDKEMAAAFAPSSRSGFARRNRRGHTKTFRLTSAGGQHLNVQVSQLPFQSIYRLELSLYIIIPESYFSMKELVSWLEGIRGEKHQDAELTRLKQTMGLTSRELQVVRQIMEGMQNKEIADYLNLAEITIKKHLTRIYKKCNVQTRFELARFVSRFYENLGEEIER